MWKTNPSKMYSNMLSDRARVFKENGKEAREMSELLEQIMVRGMKRGMRSGISQTARAMPSRNFDAALVYDCTGLSLEAVMQLKESTNGKARQ